MELSTAAALFVFSYTYNISAPPVPNQTVVFDDKNTCVLEAKALVKRFDQQHPGGIFEGQCKDAEGRTYFLIRNNRFESSLNEN